MTWLLSIYPALMITLTPGYFWYLSLTPDGPGACERAFTVALSAPTGVPILTPRRHLTAVKALLDDVNVEDKEISSKRSIGAFPPVFRRPARLATSRRAEL